MSAHQLSSVVPYEPGLADQVATLWRALHADWRWLDDPQMLAKVFAPSEVFECIRYVVRREGVAIATGFGTCRRDNTWARNRYLTIEARPENIEAAWLNPLLAHFADADRGRPDTWQVVSLPDPLWSALPPLLEAAGFAYYSSTVCMEWMGDAVEVVEPSPALFERYVGGNPGIDAEIVELRNRSHRRFRLTPPMDREHLWIELPGLTANEYVLVWDEGKLVGYSQALVIEDKAYINSLAVSRSHWGTQVAAAVLSENMRILIDRGYRKIEASVISTNAPAKKLGLRLGWRVAAEQMRAYVRKI